MITNIKEGSKIKCQQYWPDSGSVTYEPFSIKVTEQQVFPDYVVRTLELSVSNIHQLATYNIMYNVFDSQCVS